MHSVQLCVLFVSVFYALLQVLLITSTLIATNNDSTNTNNASNDSVIATTIIWYELPGITAFIVVFSIFVCICFCCVCLYKFTGKKELHRGESINQSRKVIPRSSVQREYEMT